MLPNSSPIIAWKVQPASTQITPQEQIENKQIRNLNAEIAAIMNRSSGGKRRTRRQRNQLS